MTLDNIPPTEDALLQHVKRATYEAGFIWGQSLENIQQLPNLSDWGWQQIYDRWTPRWITLPEASKSCQELIHCGCKKACRGLCKCFKANLPCTALCRCAGQCDRD